MEIRLGILLQYVINQSQNDFIGFRSILQEELYLKFGPSFQSIFVG